MSPRGFTLVEFVVVVICIGILSGLLLDRVVPLFGLAEKTAFDRVRGQLSSALLLEAAERIVRGETAALAELGSSNPMELLLTPPSNYIGTRDRTDLNRLPKRTWFFDSREGVIVYRPGGRAQIRSGAGTMDRVEFYVRLAYLDRDGNGRFDPTSDRFDGLALEPVQAFTWAVN